MYYLGIGQRKDSKSVAQASGVKGKGVPWFAFGFVGVATFNSLVGIAPAWQTAFTTLSACFLGSAMAAIGLDTDLKQMYSLGPKPIVLAAVLWFNLLFGGFAVSRFLVGAF